MEIYQELYVMAREGKESFLKKIEIGHYDFDIRDMENNQIISVYDLKERLIDEFEFDEDDNYIHYGKNSNHTFTLYNRLSIQQRIHLGDFIIINTLKNADKQLNSKEEITLFEVIEKAIQRDQTQTNPATIADEIVSAYSKNEISLEALKDMTSIEILNCAIGLGSFQAVQEEYDMEDENING